MKVRDVIKILERDGWYLDRTRGSHRQFKHSTKQGLVTVQGKPGDDLRYWHSEQRLEASGIKR
jgi:predicted RNA binding protein YcfA (HicA-like mRNA interferase family)